MYPSSLCLSALLQSSQQYDQNNSFYEQNMNTNHHRLRTSSIEEKCEYTSSDQPSSEEIDQVQKDHIFYYGEVKSLEKIEFEVKIKEEILEGEEEEDNENESEDQQTVPLIEELDSSILNCNIESLKKRNNNIVKNILKQFYNYLIDGKNSEFLSDFVMRKPYAYGLKKTKRYFKSFTFSNYDLAKILRHENYSRAFEYFITFEALDQIQSSKIVNKPEHIQILNLLRNICVQKSANIIIRHQKKKQSQ